MSVELRALFERLNQTTRTAREGAAGLCMQRAHNEIGIAHFLLKLFDAPECDLQLITAHFGIDVKRVEGDLTRFLCKLAGGHSGTPTISPDVVGALAHAWLYGSLEYNGKLIRSGFVVIALLAEDELSRLARDISPTLHSVDVSALRRDFTAIVRPSVETMEVQDRSGGARVFISYRREEGEAYADVLMDRLLTSAPRAEVFRDTDTLQPGVVFSEKIDETIRTCDIVLALIGQTWLNAVDQSGSRKLNNPSDWVRRELAAALRYKKRVVPCLIEGATMPTREELPEDLAGLEMRHALSFSHAIPRRETDELVQMVKNWWRPTPR